MKTEKRKVNVQSIPPDKAVQVTIGGIFYQRLNKLLMEYCDSVDQKELLIALGKIKVDKYLKNDQYAFNLETLIILVKAIETEFEKAGYTTDNEVELDLPILEDTEENTEED
jgi:hypothetical protein